MFRRCHAGIHRVQSGPRMPINQGRFSMRNGITAFRCALLGSAIAIVALAPAVAADSAHANLKRALAIQGNHPVAQRSLKNTASGLSIAEGTYTDLHDFAGG